jgi:hypothetical protein
LHGAENARQLRSDVGVAGTLANWVDASHVVRLRQTRSLVDDGAVSWNCVVLAHAGESGAHTRSLVDVGAACSNCTAAVHPGETAAQRRLLVDVGAAASYWSEAVHAGATLAHTRALVAVAITEAYCTPARQTGCAAHWVSDVGVAAIWAYCSLVHTVAD